MSIKSRIKKKQRRDFEAKLRFSNGFDRKIGDWELVDIHQIPSTIMVGNEFDFWCQNGQDQYVLRLRKADIERYSIVKSRGRDSVIYLVVEFDFEKVNDEVLKVVIGQLERKGIPPWRVNKIRTELKTENVM